MPHKEGKCDKSALITWKFETTGVHWENEEESRIWTKAFVKVVELIPQRGSVGCTKFELLSAQDILQGQIVCRPLRQLKINTFLN